MKQILLSLLLPISFSIFSQEISGNWSGIIESGKKEPVVFNFTFEKNGENYTTTISIPAMRVENLKPKQTTFENDTLFVDGVNLGFKFQGIYKQNLQQIEGTFTEGVNSLPMVLNKREIQSENTYRRPQEPIKPYPYHEEEVTFENKNAGIKIAGTLTFPNTIAKIVPVVILISGSGPQDRDETFYEHKPFLVLSDYLTRQGIAVLRCDDRGFGKSTGDNNLATTKDLASDVLSAIDYLKTRKEFGKIDNTYAQVVAITDWIKRCCLSFSKLCQFLVICSWNGIGKYFIAIGWIFSWWMAWISSAN